MHPYSLDVGERKENDVVPLPAFENVVWQNEHCAPRLNAYPGKQKVARATDTLLRTGRLIKEDVPFANVEFQTGVVYTASNVWRETRGDDSKSGATRMLVPTPLKKSASKSLGCITTTLLEE